MKLQNENSLLDLKELFYLRLFLENETPDSPADPEEWLLKIEERGNQRKIARVQRWSNEMGPHPGGHKTTSAKMSGFKGREMRSIPVGPEPGVYSKVQSLWTELSISRETRP